MKAASDDVAAVESAPADASPWPVRNSRQRTRDVKREAVIRAAARAFSERGYHNTSIDEIAAALNVTKPTIYYYVANKEQLLLECILTGLERVLAPFRRPRPPAMSAREQLNEIIRHYAQAIASEYGGCMVRAEDWGSPRPRSRASRNSSPRSTMPSGSFSRRARATARSRRMI